MEKTLFRLLLNYSFWKENKHHVLKEMFDNLLHPAITLIGKMHDKYKKDITIEEFKALYKVEYPATTLAQLELIFSFIDDLPGEISQDVIKEILQKAWVLEYGRRLTNASAQIVNGTKADFEEVRAILKKIEEGNVLTGDDDLQAISTDLDVILQEIEVTTKYSFNIATLMGVAKGIGPGIFTIAAARVETGKTAFGISLSAGPNGFAEQGATVHFYCNEENPQRTQGRAVTCYTGMTIQEILLNKDEVRDRYAQISNKLKFFDCRGKNLSDIERHINRHRPDICVFDQLDKVSILGSFAREDERLGALYARARDIGQLYSTAILAISQLNAEADGKYYVSSVNLTNARTSKAAEADLLIGIGKSPVHTAMDRNLNIIKNKITGNHTDVTCILRPEISRYIV